MDAEFWHRRWRKREIGFHKDEVHPYLQRFFPLLQVAPGARVLVPLCGKSLDLLWLCEQGHLVIGAELSQTAVEEFFQDNLLTPQLSRSGELTLYQAGQLQIYCGDFFALTPEQTGPVAAVYDRGALVAFPGQMRPAYAAQLLRLLPGGAQLLTISYEYPQQQMNGPPFSVPEAELQRLFGQRCEIELLHSESTLGMHSKMQAAGLQTLREEAFRLRCR